MAEFADAHAQEAITEYLEEKAPTAPKAKPTAKAKAPAKATKATKAKVDADLEDAPF